MASLMFKMGELANLAGTAKKAGTVYITKDEQSMYVDISDTERIKIQGTVAAYSTFKDFGDNVKPPFSSDVIYFIAEKNALLRYDANADNPNATGGKGKWIQLNNTAEDTQAALDELSTAIGNNATAISDLQTTVGGHGTRLTAVENKASANETNIGKNTTAIGTNATNIGKNAEAISGLDGRLDTAEGKIAANEGAISDLSDTVGGHTTNIGDLQSRMTAVEGVANKNKTDLSALTGRVSTNEGAISDLDSEIDGVAGRVSTNEGAISDLQTLTQGHTTSIGNNTTALNTLKGRVDGHDTKIGNIETAIGNDSTADSIKGRIKALEDADVTISGKVSANEGAISDLSDTVGGHGTRLTAVEKKANDNATAIGKNTTDIQTNTTNIGNNATAISGLDTRLGTAEGKITANEGNISDNATAISTIQQDIGTDTTSGTIKYRIAQVEKKATDNANLLTAHGNRLTAVEGVADKNKTDLANLTSRVSVNEGKISDIETNYATKSEVEEVESDLTTIINDKVKAVNAMTYKNSVNKFADLPTTGVKVGDTYVVATSFENGNVTYQPGDMLVASGTETGTGLDAVITSGLTWNRVETGYNAELDPTMKLANNIVSLEGATGKDLGAVKFVSENEFLTITTDTSTNAIKFDLVWGSF